MITLLLSLVIPLLVLGLIIYLVSLAPIDVRIKQAINAIAVIIVLIFLIKALAAVGGGVAL